MFKLFKTDPIKKYLKEYDNLLQAAMQAQRAGDIRSYAQLSTEADKIYQKIKALEVEVS